VGSVGEEAAKLFGALSDWARTQGTDYAGTATGAAGAFAQAVNGVNEHLATGSAECRYCPVCQAIHLVRQTSPEVRAHLSLAASSLMHAAGELLATRTGGSGSGSSPVEKIDLDAEGDWSEGDPGDGSDSPGEDPWA
jgi:predicted PhzF superfamily epimerase YddE/YHI9